MPKISLTLRILQDKFGICRLGPNSELPGWVNGGFYSVTKTPDGVSIVCLEAQIPEGIPCEKSWRAFKIEGPLDFSLIGIIAPISTLLAQNKISLFVLSTYDTDYILVKAQALDRAVSVLKNAGYDVV